MTIEASAAAILKPLVDGRAFHGNFGSALVFPAIRFDIIDTTPVQDRCGSGDDAHATHRLEVQIAARTRAEARAIRLTVLPAMAAFPVAARLDLSGSLPQDEDTKTYREQLDFLIYGSP